MTSANYRVFGLGLGSDDVRYIGWTDKPLNEEMDKLVTELTVGGRDPLEWVVEALRRGALSIFEIEPVSSAEEACRATTHLCRYFQSLGLDVKTELR